MENEIKKVAIYLRVSAEEKAKDGYYGSKVQEDKLREFCKSHNLNLTDECIYVDDGYSGSSDVSERPGLQKLINDIKQGKIDTLVVYRLDRLFRNQRKLLDTLSLLTDHGVRFRSATEAFDTETPSGRLMLQILGSFAEHERNSVRERAKHECSTCGRTYEPYC